MSAASSPTDCPWSNPGSASKKLSAAAETLLRFRRFHGGMSRCWKTPVESASPPRTFTIVTPPPDSTSATA